MHRDVSPQNIVLTTAGVVKLVDFGIAKAEGREGKTQTGIVKGKVEYMPPEQLSAKIVDHRADIFALGVVLYEAVSGKRPVDASVSVGDRLAGSVVTVPITERVPDINPELARIITKATAPDPKNRHQTADDLRTELEAFLEAIGTGIGLAELSQFLVQVFGARHVASLDRRLHSFQSGASATSAAPVAAGGVPPPPPRDGGTLIKPQNAPPPAPAEKSIEIDIRPIASASTVRRNKTLQKNIGRVASIAAAAAIVLGAAAVFATRRERDRATLHVTSTPPGAHVRVADVDVGATPLDVRDLVVGHAVEVRVGSAGHHDYREIVTPLPGVVAHTLHASLVADAPQAAPVAPVVALLPEATAPSTPSPPDAPAISVPEGLAQATPVNAPKGIDPLTQALRRANRAWSPERRPSRHGGASSSDGDHHTGSHRVARGRLHHCDLRRADARLCRWRRSRYDTGDPRCSERRLAHLEAHEWQRRHVAHRDRRGGCRDHAGSSREPRARQHQRRWRRWVTRLRGLARARCLAPERGAAARR